MNHFVQEKLHEDKTIFIFDSTNFLKSTKLIHKYIYESQFNFITKLHTIQFIYFFNNHILCKVSQKCFDMFKNRSITVLLF